MALAGVLLVGCGGQGDGAAWSPGASEPAASPGNGIEDLTPEKILARATDALEKAGSFQFKGEMADNDDLMSVDLKVDGDDVMGTIDNAGSKIHLLLVGGQPYFKANASFWKETAGPEGTGLARLIGDRWVKVAPDDKDFADIFKIADPYELLKPDGKIVKGESKTIAAGPAVVLIDKDDESRLYVATTGEPYPLLIKGPDDEGELVISGFGASFPEIEKPAESDVLDFSEFTSGA